MSPSPRAELRVVDAERTQLVARIAERDWGVLSIAELRACGLSAREVHTCVRRGWLHPLHRSVYAVGHRNLTLEGRLFAAVKACGEAAVLSHVAGAALRAAFEWDHRPVDVLVPGVGTRRHAGVLVHQTSRLDPRDVTRVRGIPVTSMARTALDCAAQLDEGELRRLVREAQARKLVTLPQLTEVLLRLGPCRGSRRLARIIATGPAPTRSVLEDAVLDLILHGGLAHPDVNVPLRLGDRWVTPDFRWPEQRLVVEADGAAWHEHKLAREDDAERQAMLEAHGERILRVTWSQAIERGSETVTRLRRAGAPAATYEFSTLGARTS